MKSLSILWLTIVGISHSLISQVPTELQGVWLYEIDGVEALSIFTPTHAGWVGLLNNRENLTGKEVTIEDKAKAYDAMWDIAIVANKMDKPGRCVSTFIHSHNPSKNGTSFSWDYEVKDGYFHYWVIRPDGQRGYHGKARKLADYDDQAPLQDLNGLYAYAEGIEGHSIICGNYALWFVVRNNQFKMNPVAPAEKAQAFDAFHAVAGIGFKLGGEGFGENIWHNLISSDIRTEKQIEHTLGHPIGADKHEITFINAAKQPVGNKFQFIRIAK